MKKIGVGFRGGLSRGFGGIGFVRFMQERKIDPVCVSGSSSGSLVAAMWAYGMEWDEMSDLVSGFKFSYITSLRSAITQGSWVDYTKFKGEIFKHVSDIQFSELKTPLIVVATDYDTRERRLISQGSVADAVIASSAFPYVFPSVVINQKKLIDGDFQQGYPTDRLKELGSEATIGMRQTSRPPLSMKERLTNNFVERISNAYESRENLELPPPNLELTYEAGDLHPTEFERLPEIINRAYESALQREKEIINLIS